MPRTRFTELVANGRTTHGDVYMRRVEELNYKNSEDFGFFYVLIEGFKSGNEKCQMTLEALLKCHPDQIQVFLDHEEKESKEAIDDYVTMLLEAGFTKKRQPQKQIVEEKKSGSSYANKLQTNPDRPFQMVSRRGPETPCSNAGYLLSKLSKNITVLPDGVQVHLLTEADGPISPKASSTDALTMAGVPGYKNYLRAAKVGEDNIPRPVNWSHLRGATDELTVYLTIHGCAVAVVPTGIYYAIILRDGEIVDRNVSVNLPLEKLEVRRISREEYIKRVTFVK